MVAHPLLHSDAANGLALAVIDSSNVPLVLLDGGLAVVAASASFCKAFDIHPAEAPGRSLFALGEGEWDVPQLRSLLETTLAGQADIEAYEIDLERPDRPSRRLVLNAQKLDYPDADEVRLLLTVSDVTAARLADKLKDDLLREKAVLLQELQHRVANSLQIVASVLMQSARRVNSEETRSHLHDAHSRVMSVAAVQRQLAASQLGEVALRPYFTDLCQSIAASMIRDHDQLSLKVKADDRLASGDTSVSLGLIVTELVINALKHAFPGQRDGEITVDYHAEASNWTLSVSDDGVGFPTDPARGQPGLGASIIEALAKHLHARVETTQGYPGTTVSIVYENPAARSVTSQRA